MSWMDDFVEWLKMSKGSSGASLKRLSSGSMRVNKRQSGSAWVDVTKDEIERTRGPSPILIALLRVTRIEVCDGSRLWIAAQGLRRENDTAYAPLRTSISGSSDGSIPSMSWPGRNTNVFCASALLATALSIVSVPRSTTLRSSGHGYGGSLGELPGAASCALRWNVTGPRLRRSGQFLHQEIRRPSRGISRDQMHDAVGYHLIADCLSRTRFIDEHECINAVVLFIGKTIWCPRGGESWSHGRVAGRELLEFCRFSGVGRARGQGQQQIAKVFTGGYWKELEGIDHHVGVAAVWHET